MLWENTPVNYWQIVYFSFELSQWFGSFCCQASDRLNYVSTHLPALLCTMLSKESGACRTNLRFSVRNVTQRQAPYLFFWAPTLNPHLCYMLPFVIFLVILPWSLFFLLKKKKLDMCHTHKINVNWRSLLLIAFSQRNLLWNCCLCWYRASTGGAWLANQQSVGTVFPTPPRPKCLSSHGLRCSVTSLLINYMPCFLWLFKLISC